MARMSKKRKLEILETVRLEEKKHIVALLKEDNLFTPSLAPLIDNYLDAFVIYKSMFEAWQDEGFPATKLHENKAGAVNEMKHPLAQHVETWNDKKNKMLDLLGMTNKSKSTQKTTTIIPTTEAKDELAAHRQKWRGKAK